jgi:hypothetical protein
MTKSTELFLACKDCGRDFTINEREREWFTSNGLAMPKRCPACRKANREAREAREAQAARTYDAVAATQEDESGRITGREQH